MAAFASAVPDTAPVLVGCPAAAEPELASTSVTVGAVVSSVKVSDPLMPLELFRRRNLATANVMGVLWAAAMFAWFFLSALYLQIVLRYDPLEVRLAVATSISALTATVFALTGFCPFRSTRIIALGLGRSQAIELESDS